MRTSVEMQSRWFRIGMSGWGVLGRREIEWSVGFGYCALHASYYHNERCGYSNQSLPGEITMIRFWLFATILLSMLWANDGRAETPSGRWRGTWSSSASGHRGALRARIQDLPDGSYKAVFAGRFAVFIPFIYRTELYPVAGSPGRYVSSKRLPLLGTYTMDASVGSGRFYATFRGGRDTGIFSMDRR